MDTLVRDPFFTDMAGFFGLTFEQLLHEKHPTAWRDFELGQIDEQALYRSFFKDGRAIDGEGLKRCMGAAYAWIDGMDAVVSELHARGVEMHLLSNYPPWYRLCVERLGIDRSVRPTFVSCHTGVRKPDAEAYLGACRAVGRDPGECLFIDDRAQNCEAARALGLAALHFDGNVAALRAELGRRALL
jgi:HAD superfamily hydrolase (TIGR01509 family)